MRIESKFSHNNKNTGMGRAYIAKIIGLHPKYKFERHFVDRSSTQQGNSTKWYKYSWDISEQGYYELVEENNYKSRREFYKLEIIDEEERMVETTEANVKAYFKSLAGPQ